MRGLFAERLNGASWAGGGGDKPAARMRTRTGVGAAVGAVVGVVAWAACAACAAAVLSTTASDEAALPGKPKGKISKSNDLRANIIAQFVPKRKILYNI